MANKHVASRVRSKLEMRRTRHINFKLVWKQSGQPVSVGEEVTVDTTAGRRAMRVIGMRAPSGRDKGGAVYLEPLGMTEGDTHRHRQYHPDAISARWVRGGVQ